MSWNNDPAEAGAMLCLDCGRILTIGAACTCVDHHFVDRAEDEPTFHRDQNVRMIREYDRLRSDRW